MYNIHLMPRNLTWYLIKISIYSSEIKTNGTHKFKMIFQIFKEWTKILNSKWNPLGMNFLQDI